MITGARVNNLKNLSLRIPKNRLVVFTGVSGSGKSSVVFGTVAAESRRQLNETYSWFVRNRLPSYGKPDAEAIDNLGAAIVVDQKPVGGNARSTVGTMTDIMPILRVLLSRYGSPSAGYSYAYSFNDPQGMCPGCDGLGRAVRLADPANRPRCPAWDEIVDELDDGEQEAGIVVIEERGGRRGKRHYDHDGAGWLCRPGR